MSEEGNKKLFAHYTAVAGGSVKSANSVSNELIVSDAKKNLADLIKKNPKQDLDGAIAKAEAEAKKKAEAEAKKAKEAAEAKAKEAAEAKAKEAAKKAAGGQ